MINWENMSSNGRFKLIIYMLKFFFFFFEVETDPEDGHIIMWDVKSGGMDNSTPYIESINEIRNLLHKTWDGMDNSTPSK